MANTIASDIVAWPEQDNRIPREIYLSQELFEEEMRAVFGGPYWTLLGHAAEIPEPGDYKTTQLGNVPIILIRDMDGNLHALVNSCAHRGTALVRAGYGNLAKSKCLTCIYHNWRYDLDGKLLSASLAEDFPADFAKEQYGLPVARLETYAGAIFVSLSDEAPPILDYLGGMTEGLDTALGDGDLVYLGSQKVMFECNWKIAAENLYDGYHAIALHAAIRLLKLRGASGEAHMPDFEKYGHIWTEYTATSPESVDYLKDPSLLHLKTKQGATNSIINIFPVGIVSDQLDTLALRFALPKGVDETEMHFALFARRGENPELVHHRVRQGSNLFGPEGLISLEDQTALARVQDGARGRGDNVALKGAWKRFPPYRILDEAGLRHFYATYRGAMGL